MKYAYHPGWMHVESMDEVDIGVGDIVGQALGSCKLPEMSLVLVLV